MKKETMNMIERYEAKIESVKQFIDLVYGVTGCENDVKIGQAQFRAYTAFLEELKGQETTSLAGRYEAKIEETKQFIDLVYGVPGCENDVKIGQAQIRAYMEIIEDLKAAA